MSILNTGTTVSVNYRYKTLFAAFGLSLIIAQSVIAFNVIKYAGAIYISFIGFRMLTDRNKSFMGKAESTMTINYLKTCRDGMITNVLNPKVALFFIAFLPQFIEPTPKNTFFPFFALGITFTITGTIWCLISANFAALIFQKLKHNDKISNYIHKVCGFTLIALDIKVAFAKNN